MSLLRDLSDGIKARLFERATDPLLSSFTIAFLLVNWEFFYILLASNESSKEAITSAKSVITIWSFIIPFLTSLFYVFVYPSVKKSVVRFYYRRDVDTKNLVKQIKLGTVLSVEDTQKFHKQFLDREENWSKKVGEASEIIELLKQEIHGTYYKLLFEPHRNSSNNSFSINIHPDDQFVQTERFYEFRGSGFEEVKEKFKDEHLRYVFKKIGNKYLMSATIGDLIPTPEQMKGKSASTLWMSKNGRLTSDYLDDSWIRIIKINDFVSQIEKREPVTL